MNHKSNSSIGFSLEARFIGGRGGCIFQGFQIIQTPNMRHLNEDPNYRTFRMNDDDESVHTIRCVPCILLLIFV